jgi:hypothetical protein
MASLTYNDKAAHTAHKKENNVEFISKLPWGLLILACLTLGLAPFNPPHIWEKLQMLARGQLVRPIDWFDLVLHGTPWGLLIFKAIASLMQK